MDSTYTPGLGASLLFGSSGGTVKTIKAQTLSTKVLSKTDPTIPV
jgi:hypothetical protein